MFFRILADELETHKAWQLPVCIRSVDKKDNTREEFLDSDIWEQIHRKAIERLLTILVLASSNLDKMNCQWERCDGVR